MKQPIIELKKTSFSYFKKTSLLKNINLSVKKGSFHFLTGVSGSGKSTLLKLIFANLLPQNGYIKVLNRNTKKMNNNQTIKIRQKIGCVFQDYRLINHLNAFDNVALPLIVQNHNDRMIKNHVMEMLEWVGIANKTRFFPEELSGGEKQRLAVARAVITDPEILLADEPTGSLDEFTAKRLMNLFMHLHSMKTTIILATHNRNLVNSVDFPEINISKKGIKVI